MKHLLVIFSIFISCILMGGYDPVLINAIAHDKSRIIGETRGARAMERFHVVDQCGTPVENANVSGVFWPNSTTPNNYSTIDILTDKSGECVVVGETRNRFRYQITKTGYYTTTGCILYLDSTNVPAINNGKWQPYGSIREITLKKIKAPVRMPFLQYETIQAPVLGQWLGFDLEKYKWTPPYGDGIHPDILVRFTLDVKHPRKDFLAAMDICFTNNPYAGMYVLKKDKDSDMKSVYNANSNAVYTTGQSYVLERRPPRYKKVVQLGEDEYIVYRTRTKIDDKGNLISAHYGKIYGPWTFYKSMRAEAMYFNPIPNDTNLEDEEILLQAQRMRGGR